MARRRQANEVTRMAGFLFVHYVPFVAKAVSISHDRLPAFARGFGPAGKEHKDNSPCDLWACLEKVDTNSGGFDSG